MPHWVEIAKGVVGLVLAVWGLIALIGGPVLFMKARTYFPERRETVTPDDLREQLRAVEKKVAEHLTSADHALREAFQREIGSVGTRITESRAEILDALLKLEGRTDEALDDAREALHKSALLESRVEGELKLLSEKVSNIQQQMSTLQMFEQRLGHGHSSHRGTAG